MAELLSYIAGHADMFLEATLEHMQLVAATLALALVLAAAVTLACLRSRRLGDAVVAFLGAVYSIPSLALFALLIPVTGLGFTSAVAVMVVYCQFMLVRNALEGLFGVDPAVLEAAEGMGMSPAQVMLRVRLPLALPAIIAGVRLATVSTIGIATIAASINAGGLGLILFSGLRTLNMNRILGGTLFCVLLALAADALLKWVERRLTPTALR